MHPPIESLVRLAAAFLVIFACTVQLAQCQASTIQQQVNNPFTKSIHDLLLDLRQQMLTHSIKFDEHFKNLLSSSKVTLHHTFTDTYGMMYIGNNEIFTSMFDSLEQYYVTGQVKLNQLMEEFFMRLYQKIFQVFNSNRQFSSEYLECATEQLPPLKPFKDVPNKLINNIRHTFVAARSFTQALNSGVDIIKSIITLKQPAQCTNLINDKLLKRPNAVTSNAAQSLSPCIEFCEQVMSRCIGRTNLTPLDEKWRSYVAALTELATKLSTSYNIENIIGPLDLQISDAIMNFQDNAQNITNHVLQVCGDFPPRENLHSLHMRPTTNRLGRRAANLAYVGPSPTIVPNRQRGVGAPVSSRIPTNLRDSFPPAQALLDLMPVVQKSPILVDEIRKYMLSTKSFWSNLPRAVCVSSQAPGSNISVPQPANAPTRKQSSCFQEPLLITDMNVDVRYRFEIHQQIKRLEVVRSKIVSALAGSEAEWVNPIQELASSVAENSPNGSGNAIFRGPSSPVGAERVPMVMSTTSTTPPPPSDLTITDEGDDDETMEDGGSGEEPISPEDPTTEDPDSGIENEETISPPENHNNTSNAFGSSDSNTLDEAQMGAADQRVASKSGQCSLQSALRSERVVFATVISILFLLLYRPRIRA